MSRQLRRGVAVMLIGVGHSACANAEKDLASRCSLIDLQERVSTVYVASKAAFEREAAALIPSGLSAERYQWARRSLLARGREEQRKSLKAQYPDMPSLWTPPTDPRKDSAEMIPQAPPRPSELAWYHEHCFEGKPR